jgi:uncharacterized protein
VTVNPVTSDQNILPVNLFPDVDRYIKGLIEVYKTKIWNLEEIYPLNEYMGRLKPEARMAWGCGAPFGNTPVVDVNGDVYLCIYLVGTKKFCLGNLFNGYPDKKIIEKILHILHVDNIKECRECNFRYLCGGGCPVKRLTIEDNPLATIEAKRYANDITCKPIKALLELLFWELAEKRYLEIKKRPTNEFGLIC